MTKINGESVTLVMSFDQLRVGLIVWITDCLRCGDTHRQFITKRMTDCVPTDPDSTQHPGELAYEIVPAPACAKTRVVCVSEAAVTERRVYVVVGQAPLAKRARSRERTR